MIGVLLGIIWFFVILKWDVDKDYKKWVLLNSTGDKKYLVNHFKDGIIRCLLLIPSTLLLVLPTYDLIILQIIIKYLVVIALQAFVWWEFFDGWYNKKRGYSWRFTGTNDKDDALSDNFLQEFTPFEIGLGKWTLIMIFLISYIIILCK